MMERIFLLLVTIATIGCKNDPAVVKQITKDIELPVSTTKNVEMLYTDSARLRAKVKAPRRDTYLGEKERIEFTEGVDVQFYDEDGGESGELKAKYAINNTKTEQMLARNNVQLVNKLEGKRLDTEELIWDQKTGRIYSDKFSKITSKQEVIYGDGFESNQDFSQYRILKIRGIVTMEE
jgi:LPS export ABC transporter protein LptC